ncbi:hypothetical protein [Pararhodobacter oceanensis]|uniref:Uncharacterized protein n=1 Tax=Pararhodobacter oceanensis TaxID=2172121 RepID=A0A2T8HY19_9RHOB|nr:hypothetical protein [Pararhodobacter oceanensis]PVH30325.1 hypothetical protein DDE20_01865 [Pararhodobacter oceanensis]
MKQNSQHPWLKKADRWFNERPEREFRLGQVPIAALRAIANAGSFVGCATASGKPGKKVIPHARPGAAQVPCIIRRADPASGRNKLGVYLIDGAAPPPRSPSAREEEQFCEVIWSLAQVADQMNVSLVMLMMNPATLVSAASLSLPVLQCRKT